MFLVTGKPVIINQLIIVTACRVLFLESTLNAHLTISHRVLVIINISFVVIFYKEKSLGGLFFKTLDIYCYD